MASKWLNLMLLAGLICSGTVGTMYGYSYVKENIAEYIKAVSDDQTVKDQAGDLADSAYSIGFIGQYAAFVPGMIFDAYGPTVTILTGAGMISVGYNLLAYGVTKLSSTALLVGIFMAGMGSKSLGMGSMLGSLNLVDEKSVATWSGIYLGFDAMSAVFAVYAFTLFFQPPLNGDEEKDTVSFLWPMDEKYVKDQAGGDKTLERIGDYFGVIGIVIAVIGCCVATVYTVGMKKVADAKEEEKKAKSEEEEALLASGEEAKIAVKGADTKTKKASKKPAAEKKTLWSGVICIYIICCFGESMGLFFNKLTAPNYQASMEFDHVLSMKQIFTDEKHGEKVDKATNTHTIEAGENEAGEAGNTNEFVVTKDFMNLMQLPKEGDNKVKKITKISIKKPSDEVDSYIVTVVADEKPFTQTIAGADAEQKIVYFSKKHKKHGKVWKSEVKVFKKEPWAAKWNVFFLFTMGNAVGRLSFGITSDILAGYKILALTKSFYIVVCCAMYIILFSVMAMIPDLSAVPALVNTIVFLVGCTYGGIFTMVTAYMKEVCAKHQVGMLLGMALVVLASTTLVFAKTIYGPFVLTKHQGVDLYKLDDGTEHPKLLGNNTLKSFCYCAIVGNIIALVVAVFVWIQHMQIKKAEIAAAEEADFTDESDDENEAEHQARK